MSNRNSAESPPKESPNKRPRRRFHGMHKIINSTKKELTIKIKRSKIKTRKWRKKLLKEKPKINDDLMKVKVLCSKNGIVFDETEALEHMKQANPILKNYLDSKKKEIILKQKKQALVDIGDPNVVLTLPQCKKIIENVTFGDKWGTTSDDEDMWRDGERKTRRKKRKKRRKTRRKKRRKK